MPKTVNAQDMREKLDRGDRVLVLDVRAEEEFEAWKLDETGQSQSVNIPYFDFMEDEEGAMAKLPSDVSEAVVVCAKGGSSEWVAELLAGKGLKASNLEGGMQAWARILDVAKVEGHGISNAEVLQIRRVSSGCISYMIIDKGSGSAAVIDPLEAVVDKYVELASQNNAIIKVVFDTHVHADHVSGARALAEKANATLVLPAAAQERGITYSAQFVSEGDEVKVGELTVKPMATPGHTSDSLTYILENKVAFTGDTLFVDSVGRPDLERGSEGAEKAAETLYSSLHRMLEELPGETTILPGHYPPSNQIHAHDVITTTLGDLKEHMSVLELDKDTFSNQIVADMPPQPGRHLDIIAVNLGQSTPDETARFEMELGPNNCASSKTSLLDK